VSMEQLRDYPEHLHNGTVHLIADAMNDWAAAAGPEEATAFFGARDSKPLEIVLPMDDGSSTFLKFSISAERIDKSTFLGRLDREHGAA
jgi:hypothetical protein